MSKRHWAAALLVAALAATPTWAQQPAAPSSPHTFTGNVGLFSQYIFRGLTQTNREPAIQGGFDYSHASGLYLGTWASNISWLKDGGWYNGGGSLEWDFYGGFKGTFGKSDFTYDVGLAYYWFPGDVRPNPGLWYKADTFEAYGALGWKWFSAKLNYSLKDKFLTVPDTRGTWYLDLSADVPLGASGFSLIAHWGKQRYRGQTPGVPLSNDTLYSYEDWKIGLKYALPRDFVVGAYYTDTSGANPLGYGSVAEGGTYPRNISKGTGTVYIQKTF
jgi:uncharacterized protein (TIGR02001 family)